MQCYNPGSQVEGGEGDRVVNQAITGVIIWHSDIEQPEQLQEYFCPNNVSYNQRLTQEEILSGRKGISD